MSQGGNVLLLLRRQVNIEFFLLLGSELSSIASFCFIPDLYGGSIKIDFISGVNVHWF